MSKKKQTATITVRHGEQSWSLTLTGKRGEGIAIADKIERWLDQLSAGWSGTDVVTMKTRLQEALFSDVMGGRGPGPGDVEIDVSDLKAGA